MRLHAALLFLALPGLAASQGDTCANPAVLTGTGSFAFDTSTMITGSPGFPASDCVPYWDGHGIAAYSHDGFFAWSAPNDGDFLLEVTGAAWQVQMSLYAGSGCNANCIGFIEQFDPAVWVFRDMVAGESILIQIAGDSPTDNGPGVLHMTELLCPTSPVDALENNDSCQTALPVTTGLYSGLSVSPEDPDYYSVLIPAGHRVDVFVNDPNSNLRVTPMGLGCFQPPVSNSALWGKRNDTQGAITEVFRVHDGSVGNGSCGLYSLDVTIAEDPCSLSWEDQFAGNGDCLNAAAIQAGTYPGMFLSFLDSDFYKVNVRDGGTIHFEATYDPDVMDIQVLAGIAFIPGCGVGVYELSDTQNGTELVSWTNQTGSDFELTFWLSWSFGGDLATCTSYDMRVWGDFGWPGDMGTTFATRCSPTRLDCRPASMR